MNRYWMIFFFVFVLGGSLLADLDVSRIAPRLDLSSAIPLPCGDQVYQRCPRVAYGNGVFLVVWQDGYNGIGWDSNILACRFTSDGKCLDKTPIIICSNPSIQEEPSVAFCNGQFLITWADFRNNRDYDLYAARLDAAGKVLPQDGFLLAGGDSPQRHAAIASDGKDIFMVVWPDRRNAGAGVYGIRISSKDGRVLDKQELFITQRMALPLITFVKDRYFLSQGNKGCIIGSDGRMIMDLPKLWSDRKRSFGAVANVWGKAIAVFNTSPRPSPWGWASNGAIIGISITPDGVSPEFSATKHGWYDLARNQADRKVKNVIVAARWRNHNGWPMGMPGGFKGSHDGTWPAGRSAVAWNGRSMIVAWTNARFVSKHKLGIRDIYIKRVLDDWAYIDEPSLKIVAGDTDEAFPCLAADGNGNTILVYESQLATGGIVAGIRIIHESEDMEPPQVVYVERRSPTEMIVAFDEPIDPKSVNTKGIAIDGIKIVSAKFRTEYQFLMRQILVQTEPQEVGVTYVLKISGIRDLSSANNSMENELFSYLCKPGVSEDSDFIVRWNVLGPFPNNWNVAFVDPANIHPSPNDSAKQRSINEMVQYQKAVVSADTWVAEDWDVKCVEQFSGERSWHVLDTISTSVLMLNKKFGKLKQSMVYLNTYVYSDKKQDAMLRVDSNDGNRVWLNGVLIASNKADKGRGLHDRTDELQVVLNEGWNQLMLQVENRLGYWAVATQLTDQQRQPLRGLTYQMANPW